MKNIDAFIMNSIKVQNPRHKSQVALLAEPKTPRVYNYNTMSTSNEMWWPFCTHHEALHYTLLKQALSVTHAHIYLPHMCNHECSIWENEPVSRIKNGRLPCAHKYGNAIAILETKPLYEKRQI